MRIQHNIPAMNSYRNYNNNAKALNANLEKLSSGYKINRAGDDAAGLAVSEKMRAQITGLNAATKNTKDAVSMVKTAEGALQEVQDMMNRMVYLSEEAANGIYDTGIDRAALQDEVVSLTQEIHRIAENANFNGKKLFTGGGIATATFQIGPDVGETLAMTDALNNDYSSFNLSELIDNICEKGESAPKDTYAFVSEDGVEHALNMVRLLRGDQAAIAEATDSSKITYGAATTGASSNGEGGLGLINVVSSFRGKLGAVQNRLEHTLNNLSVMTENIQDAESTVRDTDVAEEMMSYTKNNILIQSAQAMLAQANAVPQGVLQLLQ